MSMSQLVSETGQKPVGKLYISNAFSVSMVDSEMYLKVSRISLDFVKRIVESTKELNIPIVSAIGHEGTAKMMTQLFGIEVPCNRMQIKLTTEDILICVVLGFRLPEGKVFSYEELLQLLNEGKIQFYLIIPQKVEVSGDGMWQYFISCETWNKILRHITLKGFQKSLESMSQI